MKVHVLAISKNIFLRDLIFNKGVKEYGFAPYDGGEILPITFESKLDAILFQKEEKLNYCKIIETEI